MLHVLQIHNLLSVTGQEQCWLPGWVQPPFPLRQCCQAPTPPSPLSLMRVRLSRPLTFSASCTPSVPVPGGSYLVRCSSVPLYTEHTVGYDHHTPENIHISKFSSVLPKGGHSLTNKSPRVILQALQNPSQTPFRILKAKMKYFHCEPFFSFLNIKYHHHRTKTSILFACKSES